MIFKSIILLLFLVSSVKNFSQDSVLIHFTPTWNNQTVSIGSNYKTNENVFIEVSQLKFYLSNVGLKKEKQTNYHLLDLSDPSSLSIKIPTAVSSQLHFNLGIDSLTNMQGAQGGDLDPMYGMYWTWQSGYINMKLEGFYSKKFTGQEEFTFHLGGYSGSKNAIQNVEIEVEPNQSELFIKINLASFFNNINIVEQNMIMSPSVNAVEMSNKMAEIFSVERK